MSEIHGSDVVTKLHREDDKFVFTRTQDVEPILERNKALQNEGRRRGDFRHIASIPNVVLEQWINEGGAPVMQMNKHEFAKFIRRKLNDRDWLFLRTDTGGL